jgi:hypothetical protein
MSKMTPRKVETRSTVSAAVATRHYSSKSSSAARLSWSLPKGDSLAEFALRFGFLAPRLLGPSSARGVLELIRFREAR